MTANVNKYQAEKGNETTLSGWAVGAKLSAPNAHRAARKAVSRPSLTIPGATGKSLGGKPLPV